MSAGLQSAVALAGLHVLLSDLVEARRKPGVMSLVGMRRERACARDLGRYFRLLGSDLERAGLAHVADAHSVESGQHAAEVKIGQALRRLQPVLLLGLMTHIREAVLEGARVHAAAAGLQEASTTAPGEEDQPAGGGGNDGGGPRVDTNPIDQLGITGQLAADYAAERGSLLVTQIDATTLARLQAVVEEGILERVGVVKLARMIRDDVEQMSTYRSQLIASTEMNDAFSEAAMREMHRLGDTWKQLIASPGACDACLSIMAAGPVPIDDPFVADDGEEYDRTPIHPLCRCATVPAPPPEEQ